MPTVLPGAYHSPYDRMIAELMMRQGDIQARGAEQQGQIWGRAAENLGQIGAQYVQQRQEDKQQKARVAALDQFVDSGIWAKDPQAGLAMSVKILGPVEGVKFFGGLQGATKMMGAQNPEEARKALPMVAGGLLAAPEALRPKLYGHAREMLINSGIAGPDSLPEQWTPELEPYVRSLSGEKSDETVVVPGGGMLVKKTTGETLATAPRQERAENPEPVVINGRATMATPTEIAQAKAQGATVAPYQAPREGDKPKMYEVEVPGPNGTLIKKLVSEAEMMKGVTMAPKSVGNKPVTGAERQALAFHNRAAEALKTAEPLETNIAKYGLLDQQRLAASGTGSNYIQSDEMQAYRQAQRAFTEARLRKESGAAIPESEFKNDARTYFAQPGDSAKTIKQKQEARQKVLEGMAYSAGKAYDEYYGEPFKRAGEAPKGEKADPLGIR